MGQYELIRYKVIKNEYITFGNTNLSTKGDCNMILDNDIKLNTFLKHSNQNKEKLYCKIKSLEDQYFYQCLFKNYGYYFINELSSGNKKKKEFINNLISCDCLGGLMALVNHFKLEIKESHLLLSFKENSFTIAEYIYTNFKFNTSVGKFLEILKDYIPTNKEYFKNVNYRQKVSFKEVDEKIQFLVNVVKLKKLDSMKHLKDIVYVMDVHLKDITVQELIHTCTSISFLEIPLQTFIKEYPKYYKENIPILEDHFLKELVDIQLNEIINFKESVLTIEEIKEIEKSIPPDQLPVKLIDLNCKYNSLIKPLVKMGGPFISYLVNDFSRFTFYYIRFIIGSLDNIPNGINFNRSTLYLLLEYSQDTSECKINYLKSIDILSVSPAAYDYYIGLIKIFIKQNDTKCLQFIIGDGLVTRFIPTIHPNIKSLKVFQFFYKNMHDSVFPANMDLVSLLETNYICTLFYKTHYPIEFNQLLTNQISRIKSRFHLIESFILALFIYDNLSYFVNNTNVLDNIIPSEIKNKITIENLSLQQFQLLFQLSNRKQIQNHNLFTPPSTLVLPNCYIHFTSNENLLLFYYYNNQITNYINDCDCDDEKQLFFFENSSLLFSILGKRGDVNVIPNILSKSVYSVNITAIPSKEHDNEKYINYLNPLFLYASFFGQIQVFKLIIDKYPHLFFKQSIILNACKRYSILNDHLLLTDLLNKL